ncbi:putative RNA polymerase II subunit B1 CTD phosphatase RPAP2 [Hirschfeldia incana]|nr:putative RNA polymerase II subunit B1 CTD phosphatase RPAP2 [Hirschfeldia incana]
MSKDHQAIAINDAVHKIQLALLNGAATSQNHIFSAGKLMSQSDYEDVVTERTIAKLCGYPLCRSSLPSDVSRRGKYRVSLKEHRVYDVRETRKFCSSECLVSSRAFAKSLEEVRTSEFDMVKLSGILGLFGGDGGEDVEEEEGLGLDKLTIRENSDVRGGGEVVALEEWMGPSSAVEGYVPFDRSNCKSSDGKNDSKAKNKEKKQEDPPFNEMGFSSEVIIPDDCSVPSNYNCKQDSKAKNKQKKQEDPPSNEMGFTSEVIIPDEFSVSKLPPQTKQPSPVVKPEDGQGKTPKKSRFRREKEKEKIDFASFGFDAMGCATSVTGNDGYSVEYSVSKQPPCSTEDPLSGQLKDGLKTLDEKCSLTGSSSASKGKGFRPPPRRKQASHVGESSKGKTVVTVMEDIKSSLVDEMGVMSDGYSVEYNVSKQPPSSIEDPLSHLEGSQTLDKKTALLGSSSGSNTKGLGKKAIISDSCEGHKAHQDVCSSSETVTKSCLKVSGSKRLSHSVTWADQSDVRGDLCEFRSNDIDTEDADSASRLALAEACAKALSQAAEAVSSGELDASDAAAEAGIVLLPSTHQLDEEVSEEEMSEEEEEEEEATLLKWPNKPGMPDSDLFDRDQSWFDETPEGFNLTLSTFAMMWDALFGWVSSSSLAYIYGKDESAHEEFLSVNGKEYPRRIVLGEGLSSEIKGTVAVCLARAVSRVATDLRLPTPISELEKGLGSLLETMSLTGAVPSFRLEQWLVIVLLFLDALSVARIPRIAPYISNRSKVLEGSGIGNEEYETMKDILLPLGRVPQFATLSGA